MPETEEIGGIDRGIAVTAALPDGTLLERPGFLAEARDEIAAPSRRRECLVKSSPERRQLNKAIATAYRKAHHRSENRARHAAKDFVARYGVIARNT